MPPGGEQGEGGDRGSTEEQNHPPATGRDEVSPSHPLPLTPATTDAAFEVSQKQEEELPPLPAKAVVEILSRVPYKSLCRFKCVSKQCLALCSDPAILKRSPQTLSGFFFNRTRGGLTFRNLSGGGTPLIDPKLRFLRGTYKRFEVEQGCGSILLLRCWKSYTKRNKDKYDHVVCNPATEEWRVLPLIVLPDPEEPDVLVFYDGDYDFFLGFEAATPSRFMVFAPLTNSFCEFGQVAVYSSETGRWTALPNEWGWKTVLLGGPQCVFLNGIMHLSTHYASIVTVDTGGKKWGEIDWPNDMVGTSEVVTIGKSQGLLHAWQIDNDNDSQLYVWVLEDYASGTWTLKHTVKVLELFGRECYKDEEGFTMFAIHPDRNLVYLTDEEEMTVSYDMDSQKVQVMCSKELACGVPYTPCFTEWSSAGN